MPTRTRFIIVSILILLGGALFSYCVFFYPIDITIPVKGGSTTISTTKAAPVKDATASTGEQNKSGQVKQGRSERKSPPKAGSI